LDRLARLLWPAAIVGLIAAGAALTALFVERRHEMALVRADADHVPQDAALLAVADRIAKPLYARNCAGCHGADLRGDTAKGVPDLTSGRFLYGFGQVSEIEHTIAYGIRSGRPKSWNLAAMPAFGAAAPYARYKIEPLKPGEIDDVVEYLVLVSGRPADSAAVARGHAVYTGRGLCFDCHADDAGGDPSIGAPGLVGPAWLYGDGSRAALRKSITYGHGGICPGLRGPFDPAGARALALYVYQASHHDGARP
jgi:cytochrome c oxidase cbb3-type subunit 3